MSPVQKFSSPSVLTDETEVLGVPLKEWNKAFVGDFEKSLTKVKQRAERGQGEVPPDLPSESSTIDSKK